MAVVPGVAFYNEEHGFGAEFVDLDGDGPELDGGIDRRVAGGAQFPAAGLAD